MSQDRYKYPRTMNLPFSESESSDDVWLKTTDIFNGKNVVVSEKLDGEQTNLYRDYFHARSIDGKTGLGQSWVKGLWGNIRHKIPPRWRICGENLYAAHSIWYWDLPTYFFVYSVWEDDLCLSWNDTIDFCDSLDLKPVPVIYRGSWNEPLIRSLDESFYGTYEVPEDHLYDPFPMKTTREGWVVRLLSEFRYQDFSTSVAKYVRKNHVRTSEHWSRLPFLANRLR